MRCPRASSPTAISAQGMQTIWHMKNICCDGRKEASSDAATGAAGRDTVLVCIFFFLCFHFLLFKAMRQGMDCSRTMEPSLRARSLIPHIHSHDRTHPSVLSLHAESESLRSHCSALSEGAGGHAGVGAEEKNSACSWQWEWSRLIRRGLGVEMEPGYMDRTGAGGGLLELLFELKMNDGAVGQWNLKIQVWNHYGGGAGPREARWIVMGVTSSCAPSSAVAGRLQKLNSHEKEHEQNQTDAW